MALAPLLTAALVLSATRPAAPQPAQSSSVTAYGDAVSDGGPAALNAPVLGMAATPDGHGYWLVASDGGVFAYGDAGFHGSLAGTPGPAAVLGAVAMAATPDGGGYWEVNWLGSVQPFGDAGSYGSVSQSLVLNARVVAIAATPDGKGYWLAAADGGVFAFGDAGFFGSAGGTPLNAPVVGMAASPDGHGYWLVAADGGVFAFGDARFYGSEGATPLNVPIVGMAAAHDGDGYWLAAGDGGVFAFGSATFDGSAGAAPPAHPVAAIAATPDGGGYWLATSVTGPTPVPSLTQASACGVPQVQPATFVLACADHNSLFEDLRWSSWSPTLARATGTYVYNTCTPDCAAGTFVSVPGTIWLDEPVSTSAGVEFSRVTWSYPGPAGVVTYSDRLSTDT